MGPGGRRRVRSLMGSAVSGRGTTIGDGGDMVRGKGTTVGEGGDGLARKKGRRFGLCHPKMVSTGGGRRIRSLVGAAVCGRGANVGDGDDGLARSKNRCFCLCHLKMVSTPACVQKEGRYVPGSGRGGRCRNPVAVTATVLDVREV